MKLQYLGTAAAEGIPGIFCRCEVCQKARVLGGKDLRRRSGAFLDDRLLIDVPPDLYAASLALGIDLSVVEDILVTHVHRDHFYLQELDDYAPMFAHRKGVPAVRLHGSETVRDDFRREYEWRLDGFVEPMVVHPYRAVEIAGYTVMPLRASHGAGISLIYAIEGGGKRLLYANDTGFPGEEVWEHLKGMRFDLVSMDCTSVAGPAYESHMNIEGNLKMRQRLLDMGSADEKTVFVVTHFSHNGGLLHDEIVARFADVGALVAYDGFTVEV